MTSRMALFRNWPWILISDARGPSIRPGQTPIRHFWLFSRWENCTSLMDSALRSPTKFMGCRVIQECTTIPFTQARITKIQSMVTTTSNSIQITITAMGSTNNTMGPTVRTQARIWITRTVRVIRMPNSDQEILGKGKWTWAWIWARPRLHWELRTAKLPEEYN